MGQIDTSELRAGVKIEMEGQPYTVVSNQFVKPGKGQAFSRVKLKHLITGRVIERNFKSGETFEVADVKELRMRLLYVDGDQGVFMEDETYEQMSLSLEKMEDIRSWLLDDQIYALVFYKGEIATVEPPT